ncbi:membrane-spanning 4-domains subfamily A member 12-like [Dipodomys spectabilis]|uniref:membrane-spanning 4-domains subfamily A member 12-like n=1 Tax=Dipodomys spectabilis TaxID=105255 RepID=UPI001C539ADE|nr:membrane-spanning 4-domains subfamily A member 12-like [Dipodomys spectabilis]
MKPSKPTPYPGMQETMPNPYPPGNPTMAPASQPAQYQQSLSFMNVGNQAQAGQFPFMTSPGLFHGSQLAQGNVQIVNLTTEPAAVNLREEGKILGAIQIIIGVMQIGFGTILGLLAITYSNNLLGFVSLTFLIGYPFWGGLCFIISGSLSVSASKEFSPCLIKGSLGMNIVSSIFAIVGIILFLVDLIINGVDNQAFSAVLSGKGISSMLLIFSILEVCIACTTAHFAKQAITNTNRSALAIPNMYASNPVTQSTPAPPPRFEDHPAYAPR